MLKLFQRYHEFFAVVTILDICTNGSIRNHLEKLIRELEIDEIVARESQELHSL